MNKKLLAVLMSSAFLLTACGGDDDSSVFDDGIPKNNIVNPVVATPTAYTLTDMSASAADSVVMTYKMLGVNGKEVQATSLVFTPKTPVPKDGWPIVIWAHGTTGVADICAPSRLALGSDVKNMISKFLAEGYVVVAPDYEGLGSAGDHPFLNVKSEAYSITDAVVAARNWLGTKASKQWVTVGHSQGGQAALGAAQYASRAQLNYKGTVAIAPASNLASILTIGEQQASTLPINYQIQMLAQLDTYTALIVAGMQGHNKSVTYNEVFKNDTVILAPIAEAECSSTVGVQLGTAMSIYAAGIGQGTLTGYGRLQSGFMSILVIDTFLKKDSQPGLAPLNKKVFIYQGEADTTVPKAATDLLIASMKANGTSASNIQYTTSAAWDHGTVYTQNYTSFVDNIDSLFQ